MFGANPRGCVGRMVMDETDACIRRRKLKLGDFYISIYGASEKVIFGSLGYPVLS